MGVTVRARTHNLCTSNDKEKNLMLSSDFNQIKVFFMISLLLTLAIVLKSSNPAPQLAWAVVGGLKAGFSCDTMRLKSCLD